jgi:hypothetical protein
MANVRRLKKILLLAFEGGTDGERIAALDMAKHLLEADGKDPHWLVAQLDLIEVQPKHPSRYANWSRSHSPTYQPERAGWGKMLEYCSREPVLARVGEREYDFIQSLVRQTRRHGRDWVPTTRQINWLAGIYTRMKVTDI